MLTRTRFSVSLFGCVCLAACSGGDGSGTTAGGKASTQPLVLNLQATPSPAWLNAAVTFAVTCQSVVGDTNLQYVWNHGDGTSETTNVPTDEHTYTTGGSYQYSVTCQDGTQSSSIQAPQALTVRPYDLNTVAAGTCSTGLQGLGWCWQRPVPTGGNLTAIAAITPLSAWAVGDAGTVLSTNDGGDHWLPRYPNTGVYFVGIYATDHNQVTLAAADGSVWSTNDAGTSWTSVVPTSGTYALSHASMIDAQNFWAINNGNSIVQTTNGGASWSPINVSGGLPSGAQFNALSAAHDKTVWAVGNLMPAQGQTVGAGLVAQTTDGTNWSTVNSPLAPGFMLNTVSVTAGSRCSPSGPQTPSVWIAGIEPGVTASGAVYSAESLDNGTSWGLSNTGGGALIAAFDSNTAWQTLPYRIAQYASNPLNVGFGITTTGNNGWQFPTPDYPFYPPVFSEQTVFPAITAMDSADCQSGWAVGKAGVILQTPDGGGTFVGQAAATAPSTANNLSSILAVSPLQAFVLAIDAFASGNDATVLWQILDTDDGGITWLSDIGSYNSITFGVPGGGVQALPLLTLGQIAGNAAGDIVAVGPGLLITKSSLPIHAWSYNSGGINDDGSNVVSPPLPGGGTSWGYQSTLNTIEATRGVGPGQAYEVWKSAAVSSKSAWVIDGLGDVLEQDTPIHNALNGAPNWKLVAGASTLPYQPAVQPPPAGGNAIAAIDLPSGVVAVIIGANGLISRSVDMGNTWTPVSGGTTANLNATSIITDGVSAGIGWAVGAGSTILRTLDGGATWSTQTWAPPAGIDPASVNLKSVSTVDGQAAWIVASQANCAQNCSFVLYTSDGGNHWTQQAVGAEGLNSVAIVDPNTAWVIGVNAGILKTVTAGSAPAQ